MRGGTRSCIRLLAVVSVVALLGAGLVTGGRMVFWKIAGESGTTTDRVPESAVGGYDLSLERSVPTTPEEDGGGVEGVESGTEEAAGVDAVVPEELEDASDSDERSSEDSDASDDQEAHVLEEAGSIQRREDSGWDNPLETKPSAGQLGQPSTQVVDEQALRRAAAVHQPKVGTMEFLPEYKNPCWREGGRLRCLPYVYFAGVFQSGTRDLYARLAKHPQVVMPHNPSFHYWIEWVWELDKFVELYDKAAQEIERDPAGGKISFNGSPGLYTHYWAHSERAHMAFKDTFAACWKNCMESNRGNELQRACILTCFQPARDAQNEVAADAGMQLELPHLIRAVHGLKARFVVLLRNPTERLHHAFYFHDHYRSKYGNNPEGFLAYAKDQIEPMKECYRKRGNWRECVLAFESVGPEEESVFFHADQVCRGVYSVFLEDWLHAFPRKSLLLLKAEEYYADPRPAVQQVVQFLGLDEPTPRQWEDMMRGTRDPTRAGEHEMLPEAREYVESFYRPFNRALAEMLGDDRFLWQP